MLVYQPVKIVFLVDNTVVVYWLVGSGDVLHCAERDRIDHAHVKASRFLQNDVCDCGIFFLCPNLLGEHISQTISVAAYR
jgi:hypothetical protein